MKRQIQILLQTTIPPIKDDWNITRFSLLRDYLASLTDNDGNSTFEVTADPDESRHVRDDRGHEKHLLA
jgi:hypothetical protein